MDVGFHFPRETPRRGIARPMVLLCLTVWETTRLFSKAASPPYVATSSTWVSSFVHVLDSCYHLSEYRPPTGCGRHVHSQSRDLTRLSARW